MPCYRVSRHLLGCAARLYKDNFLTAAFLKVSHDVRYGPDSCPMANGIYLEDYLRHISRISSNHTQESLFSLVLFNICTSKYEAKYCEECRRLQEYVDLPKFYLRHSIHQ